MVNESSVQHEEYRPSEQTPDDHGEIQIPRRDEEELVGADREYNRPSESESTPPPEHKTVLVDDQNDPVSSKK